MSLRIHAIEKMSDIQSKPEENTNPTPSDDKTTTTGQQHISHLTHAWPEPDSKLMVGSNPKATPSSQEEMEQVRIHMEKMGKQPFNKTVSHPEHVPRPVEKDISGEERPAISEFDRALDKLTGVYNNAHLMAEDIHSHPELSKKTYRRHKSESENKTSEEMFEEALDKISSAYGSSHITARDRLSGKSDEGVAYQWRLTEKGDSRKQLDEALDKLTAPFNSTRITPEEMLDANTLPSKETVKPGIQEPGQSRDYFEEAAHKLTAVYSSSADQADDIQHIVDEEFHIAHGKPPINVPEARNRTPLDDALDSLQNKLHKGLHVEDFPRYHWPEVPQEQRTKEGEAHPITDAVKDLMTKSKEMAEHGLEKSQEMAEQGVEKGKELSGSATEKGKELAESALQKGKEVTGTALEKGKEVTGSALERGKEMSGSAIEKGKEMLPEVEFAGRKNEPVNQTYAPASDIPERELNERAIESIKHYTKPVHQTYEPARDIDRKSELAREGMSTADSTIDKTGLDFERYRGAGSGALRQRILQEGQEGKEPAERANDEFTSETWDLLEDIGDVFRKERAGSDGVNDRASTSERDLSEGPRRKRREGHKRRGAHSHLTFDSPNRGETKGLNPCIVNDYLVMMINLCCF
ncbi:uncharacterized protein LOC136035151 isoform X3 [Artemia franciscana]|uniref:uncharacterized protein LOC136035151 isoform X3 n=1 Tax=Artemia franciscana TaxID=6661 RepID=UPI0032DB0639